MPRSATPIRCRTRLDAQGGARAEWPGITRNTRQARTPDECCASVGRSVFPTPAETARVRRSTAETASTTVQQQRLTWRGQVATDDRDIQSRQSRTSVRGSPLPGITARRKAGRPLWHLPASEHIGYLTLHPALFLVVLDGASMQRCAQPVRNHLLVGKVFKSGV